MNQLSFNKSFYLLFLSVILGVFSGCADRKHDNPLDPDNPVTGGRLTGLSVVSFNGIVFLSWDEIKISDYIGTRVLRATSLDSEFVEIALVAGIANRYDDLHTVFDVTYRYKIQAITDSFESPLSEQVTITPGPSRVWINNGSSGILLQLTHDASHVLFSNNNFFDISGMAIISGGNGVWISDFITKQIAQLTINGEELIRFTFNDAPIDLDYDSTRERLWFLVQNEKRLVFGSTEGDFRVIDSFEFTQPVAISVDQSSGVCWVTDTSEKTVTNFNLADSTGFVVEDLDQPEDVATYYEDGSIWIADVSSIKHFGFDGGLKVSVGNFNFVYQVNVNQNTGACWAIDLQSGENNSQIVKMTGDGSIEFRLDGFTNPASIDVDEYDGSCLVADTGNSRVVKISDDGKIKGEWLTSGGPNLVRVSSP